MSDQKNPANFRLLYKWSSKMTHVSYQTRFQRHASHAALHDAAAHLATDGSEGFSDGCSRLGDRLLTVLDGFYF